MLDLSRYEGDPKNRELLEEIKKLRSAGAKLAEAAEMIAAEYEPLNPECLKCEHIDQVTARKASSSGGRFREL
jgi:DNA-binding transcriptional MerR regulator